MFLARFTDRIFDTDIVKALDTQVEMGRWDSRVGVSDFTLKGVELLEVADEEGATMYFYDGETEVVGQVYISDRAGGVREEEIRIPIVVTIKEYSVSRCEERLNESINLFNEEISKSCVGRLYMMNGNEIKKLKMQGKTLLGAKVVIGDTAVALLKRSIGGRKRDQNDMTYVNLARESLKSGRNIEVWRRLGALGKELSEFGWRTADNLPLYVSESNGVRIIAGLNFCMLVDANEKSTELYNTHRITIYEARERAISLNLIELEPFFTAMDLRRKV